MIKNIDLVLDISVNLARVSDWVLSKSQHKQQRMDQFLKETEGFLLNLSTRTVPSRFQPTLRHFQKEFQQLLDEKNETNKNDWAEKALTWANILQHRAKFA
ncbi:hypothetical protein HY384_02875 [Candidatus Daviesbacteria bacterium]|nr:hypothetical protein [Candidatus Daviesbacteria bacterium]